MLLREGKSLPNTLNVILNPYSNPIRYHSFHFAKEETELSFREVMSPAQSPVSPKLQSRDFNSKRLYFTVQVLSTPQQK